MGVIVNTIVVVISSFLGLQIRTGIPEKIQERLMEGIGLCVIGIGINGFIKGQNTLVLILSVVVGTLIGEWIDIDYRVIDGVNIIEKKFVKKSSSSSNFSQAFISASLLFCIGSMSIVGSLESGLTGDNTTLYTKSILDAITSFLLSSSLGLGVLFSAIPLFIIQGSLFLFALLLAPLLPDPVIVEIVSVGSILLVGLGLNILRVTDLKIMNFTPAIFLPILFMLFF